MYIAKAEENNSCNLLVCHIGNFLTRHFAGRTQRKEALEWENHAQESEIIEQLLQSSITEADIATKATTWRQSHFTFPTHAGFQVG